MTCATERCGGDAVNEHERQCNVIHGLRRKLEEASKLHDGRANEPFSSTRPTITRTCVVWSGCGHEGPRHGERNIARNHRRDRSHEQDGRDGGEVRTLRRFQRVAAMTCTTSGTAPSGDRAADDASVVVSTLRFGGAGEVVSVLHDTGRRPRVSRRVVPHENHDSVAPCAACLRVDSVPTPWLG